MDQLSVSARSENMRRIRSKGTAPEIAVRRIAHRMGYRFRLHRRDLPGRPDLVFPSLKRIIDVRGCFWHQHPGCIDSHIPKSRRRYWVPKLRTNVLRDRRNRRKLIQGGWTILVLWECEVLRADPATLARAIQDFLGEYSA